MDTKVTFSMIAISATLAIFFGIVITAPNSAWASPQVKVDSARCSEDLKSINVQFSWSGFDADDDLELNVSGNQKFPLLSKKYDGTSDGSGSGEFSISLPTSSELMLELNAAGSGGDAMTVLTPPSCGIVEKNKK
jgi:hypothetical protein